MIPVRKEKIVCPCVYILKEYRKSLSGEKSSNSVERYHVYHTIDLEARIKEHKTLKIKYKCGETTDASKLRRVSYVGKRTGLVSKPRHYANFEIPWVLYTKDLDEAKLLCEKINALTKIVKEQIVKNERTHKSVFWLNLQEKNNTLYGDKIA